MAGPAMQVSLGMDGAGVPFTLIAANTINATLIYAGAGAITGVEGFTNGAVSGYLKLYDKATAPTTSDAALCIWEGIIPGSASSVGSGFAIPDINRRFILGLGMILSGAIALNDNNAVAASSFVVNIGYLKA